MIAYLLIVLFLALLAWILFGPLMLIMDTDRQRYLVSLPGIVTARLVWQYESIYIRLWIFFIPLRIDPFKSRVKVASPAKKRRKNKSSRRRPGFRRILQKSKRAIRIHRLELDLDTDDFPLNAQLIPVFSAINNEKNIALRVNFEGRLSLKLDLRTRMASLLRMFITK